MSKSPPAFQFYPADFLVGTAGMSHSSKATFLLLLCYEWIQINVRLDMESLPLMLGISAQDFAQDWEEVQHKFTVNEQGFLHNEKLESIRDTALALSAARKEAGRKGGSSKALAKLKQRGKQKASKGRLKTEDRRLKINTEEKDNFEQFWTLVKTKVGKDRASKHYAAAVNAIGERESDPHEFLRSRLEAYQQSDRFRGEFPWEPCSWLRDGHYDDDPQTWKGRNGKSQTHTPGPGQRFDPNATSDEQAREGF